MAQRNEYSVTDDGLFDGKGSFKASVTAAQLIEFEHADPRAKEGNFIEAALFTISDELDILSESLELNDQDYAARSCTREANRLRVLVEVIRRRAAAKLADASGLFVADVDDAGEPDLNTARAATAEDLSERGFITVEAARAAVHSLCGKELDAIDEAIAAAQREQTIVDNEVPDEPESAVVPVATAVAS